MNQSRKYQNQGSLYLKTNKQLKKKQQQQQQKTVNCDATKCIGFKTHIKCIILLLLNC